MTTDLRPLIAEIQALDGKPTRELEDRVLLAIGFTSHADPSPGFDVYWLDPRGMRFNYSDSPQPLSNLQDATLVVPGHLTFSIGPGLNGGRLALVDEPEWFYRSSSPRPCIGTAEAPEDPRALVLASLKAIEQEAEDATKR